MARRISAQLGAFFATETAGGVVLVLACAVALVFANSPIRLGYAEFWRHSEHFINEGLMSVFFFLVGLEIKREFTEGELGGIRSAALPIISAIGGMVTPALIFALFNHGGSGAHAWAVAMPTDVALAVGALTLLGSRLDPSIKIFLLSLAVADDIGSLIVMSLFYSAGINPIRILTTIGAVVLAWVIPTRKRWSTSRLISLLNPWSAFFIVPLFVLANIGLTIDFHHLGALFLSPISTGIAIGRVVGKLVGITLFAWLAVKLGLARRPASLRFKDIAGAGALAGMGLTVSLFIANLAVSNQEQMSEIKIGLITSAIISGAIGLTMLRKLSAR